MRLGKKEAAGYVTDIEAEEIPDAAVAAAEPELIPVIADSPEAEKVTATT